MRNIIFLICLVLLVAPLYYSSIKHQDIIERLTNENEIITRYVIDLELKQGQLIKATESILRYIWELEKRRQSKILAEVIMNHIKRFGKYGE